VRLEIGRRDVTYRRRRSSGETHPTIYARALRLKHIHPGGLACFLLFEGAMAIAVLMALAEFVNWWAVLLLPVLVAALVKVNDLVAGVFSRTDVYRRGRIVVLRPVIWARGVASVPANSGGPVQAADAASVAARRPSAVYGVSSARRNEDTSIGVARPVTPRGHRRATNQRRFVPVTALRTAGRAGR